MAKTKILKKIFNYIGHTSMSSESSDFWAKIPKHLRVSMVYKTIIPGQPNTQDHDLGITTKITIRYKESEAKNKFKRGLHPGPEDDYQRLRNSMRDNY